jgi:hypothetical protein
MSRPSMPSRPRTQRGQRGPGSLRLLPSRARGQDGRGRRPRAAGDVQAPWTEAPLRADVRGEHQGHLRRRSLSWAPSVLLSGLVPFGRLSSELDVFFPETEMCNVFLLQDARAKDIEEMR